MDNTHQDSGSNAGSVTGVPTTQQTSRGTQTGATMTTQPGSFQLFGNLPPELKLKILNIAAREVPRTIEMTPQGNHRGYAPALLGVSHMAREEALKVYIALRPRSLQRIWFNPDNDTLILNIGLTMSTISRTAPPVLTSIALAPAALTPIVLPAPESTLIALPLPAMYPFSLGAPALDRLFFFHIVEARNTPEISQWMASMGIKSFVIRLGF
ncbi:uncharacterized protein EAE98_003954 [Botrytis deweyae]|uniref:2EXR domain-containing protein n=1 Tax=Botrytis deweyae TaxID=2478750 RepID=A0ABQ7IS80_9HELO|nr:uncharacterized protein EAE98_003954 [Botrytis deweyae]KAF7932655.1 hypothetical protein EAE98_003954 [Botrytis deweyae]